MKQLLVFIPTGLTKFGQVFDSKPVPIIVDGRYYELDTDLFVAKRLVEKPHQGRYSAIVHGKLEAEYIIPWQSVTHATVVPLPYARLTTGSSHEVASIDYPQVIGMSTYYATYAVFYFWKIGEHYCTVHVTFRLDRYDPKHLKAWVQTIFVKYAVPKVVSGQLRAQTYSARVAFKATDPTMCWDDGDSPRSYTIGDIVNKTAAYLPAVEAFKAEAGTQVLLEVFTVDPNTVAADIKSAIRGQLRFEDLKLIFGSLPSNPYGLTDHFIPAYDQQNVDFLRGRAKAYVEAIRDVPRLSDNMLQNLAECFSILYSFASVPAETSAAFTHTFKNEDPKSFNSWKASAARLAKQRKHYSRKRLLEPQQAIQTLPDAPNALRNGWLGQRYAVNTAVMDGQQAWDYFWNWSQQLMGMRSDEYKCHGPAVIQLEDGTDCVFRCTCVLKERALRGVSKALHDCYMKGLEPNAYVLWDFVPFSFVVDWFVPIGDALEGYTLASHFTPEYWEFQPEFDGRCFCYSVKYKVNTPYGPASVYTRWYETGPPDVEAAYFLYDDHPTSGNTILKRTLDGIALFGAER